MTDDAVTTNPWLRLRSFTDARIGLGRAGISIPTQPLLQFQLAHAKARDAVHTPLDVRSLLPHLQLLQAGKPPLQLHSQASDRALYLQRPDYGRLLDEASVARLGDSAVAKNAELAIVIADGLSALAIEENVVPFLRRLLPSLTEGDDPWQLAPLCVVEQGRVAVGDHVGELLQADCVLMLIGERPGLSSPDSMGLYLTWKPRRGLTDASRNCISNIRPAGLSYSDACRRTLYLLNEARRLKLSGVQLKDRSDDNSTAIASGQSNFLVSD